MDVAGKVTFTSETLRVDSEIGIETMKLRLSIALLLSLTPTLAFAKPKTASGHLRPQLFHDRTPKAHVHSAKPHISQ
jgi:hypothetical protein